MGEGSYGIISTPDHKRGSLFGVPFLKIEDGILWTPKKIYFSKTFYFRDTMGLPLSFIFDKIQQFAGSMKFPVSPCLGQFESDALIAGWSKRKVLADIREALGETFGSKKADELMEDLGAVLFTPNANSLK